MGDGMTTELYLLAATLILAFVQIMLPGIARTRQYGARWNVGPRDEVMPPVGAVTGRLERAQSNLFETLPLFIGIVLIAHVAGKNGALTFWGAQLYFWARVAYVPLYALGVAYVRSLAFLVAFIGLSLIFAAVLIP